MSLGESHLQSDMFEGLLETVVVLDILHLSMGPAVAHLGMDLAVAAKSLQVNMSPAACLVVDSPKSETDDSNYAHPIERTYQTERK